MNRHLVFGDDIWCDEKDACEATDDPRDATCTDCLKQAAAYGAAAAMRYAAVEAGASRDPELVRERDAALAQVNRINRAVAKQGGFFCTSCGRIRALADRGIAVNDVVWCADCAPHRKVPS